MTTTNAVLKVLKNLQQSDLTREWIDNDIIKKQLAISYDEWVKEFFNNEMDPISLEDHINYYLENWHLILEIKEQSE